MESHGLSLGRMTITEAMAMISLGHVHDSVPRARDGVGKKVGLTAKVKGAVYTWGPWGVEPGGGS